MNIAIFTDTYTPQINGVVTSICTLEQELRNLGHNVYIVTTSNPDISERFPHVFRIPSINLSFVANQRLAVLFPPRLFFKFKKLNLDIVHTHTEFPVGILGKLVSEYCKIPIIHTYHTMYEDYTHYIAGGHLITPGMTKRYSRIFCNRVDTVIAPTNKTKNLLLDYGVIKPIEVIPTGLNFSVIDFNFSQRDIQDERVRLGIPSFAPLIVSIGRVAKEKSLDILISAMKTLVELVPDIRLLIIGDGPQLTELKGLSVRLGIRDRVIFAGARPWASIGKYYKMADLFASASITETQGLTYIEAMIAKTPVVARKDKSIEGIIENDKTGYLFSMQSDLISAICRVINNKKNTKHVVKEAYNRVSHLRSDIFAKKVESLYLEQIANKILEKYQKISRA